MSLVDRNRTPTTCLLRAAGGYKLLAWWLACPQELREGTGAALGGGGWLMTPSDGTVCGTFVGRTYLELEITLSQEQMQKYTACLQFYVNSTLHELRRLFLVQDLVDSLKVGLLNSSLCTLGFRLPECVIIVLCHRQYHICTDVQSESPGAHEVCSLLQIKTTTTNSEFRHFSAATGCDQTQDTQHQPACLNSFSIPRPVSLK